MDTPEAAAAQPIAVGSQPTTPGSDPAVAYDRVAAAAGVAPSDIGVAPSDIRDEVRRLTDAMARSGIRARLMGGLAVWLTSPSVRLPPYAREYRDMDFVALSRDSQRLRTFLGEQGYAPDRHFNAIHGAQRLIFEAREGQWSIDVILDELRMSHRLDLRDRLGGPRPTLPLADLLMTKLQIWELNEKDLGDALCLLVDHPLTGPGHDGAPGGDTPGNPDEAVEPIELARLRTVLGADWGLCHTVERNLERLAELGRAKPPTGGRFDSDAQVDALRSAIASAPKSIGWRARAQVGERVRWYETPEEVRR